jgi:hypothetical protein
MFYGDEMIERCFQNIGNRMKPALRAFLRFIVTSSTSSLLHRGQEIRRGRSRRTRARPPPLRARPLGAGERASTTGEGGRGYQARARPPDASQRASAAGAAARCGRARLCRGRGRGRGRPARVSAPSSLARARSPWCEGGCNRRRCRWRGCRRRPPWLRVRRRHSGGRSVWTAAGAACGRCWQAACWRT